MSKKIVYIIALVLSIALIVIGSNYTKSIGHKNGVIKNKENEIDELIFAKVVSVDSETEVENGSVEIVFTAEKLFGKNKEEIIVKQIPTEITKKVHVGDKIMAIQYEDTYSFEDYYRLDIIIYIFVAFVLIVIIEGRFIGFNSILSLCLSCSAVLFVYIPAIRSGQNIYYWTLIVCAYMIVTTFVLVYGINRKSITTIISCSLGVAFSWIFTITINKIAKMTGYINQKSFQIPELLGIKNLDLRAILFSMIVIGCLGTLMDVCMSIASSMFEIKNQRKGIRVSELIASGLKVGKDIMGTMTNTLVLAYLGSNLMQIIVYSASNYSVLGLLNKEEIIFEFLQSLIGSMCILFAIPCTAILAGFIFSLMGTNKNYNTSNKTRYMYYN